MRVVQNKKTGNERTIAASNSNKRRVIWRAGRKKPRGRERERGEMKKKNSIVKRARTGERKESKAVEYIYIYKNKRVKEASS